MRYRNDRGFTTIEVLVSIVVFAVAMAGLSSVLHATMRTNVLAARLTTATNIAQEQMEELQEMPLSEVSSGSTVVSSGITSASTSGENTPDGNVSGGTNYSVKWAVQPGPSGTKEVVVTVSWDSEKRHVQMKTLVF